MDHVDILYLHRFDPDTPLEETLECFADLKSRGQIGHVGLSNFAAWQVMKAACIAARSILRVSILQPMYSLVKRQAEVEILPMAASEGMAWRAIRRWRAGCSPASMRGRDRAADRQRTLRGPLRSGLDAGGGHRARSRSRQSLAPIPRRSPWHGPRATPPGRCRSSRAARQSRSRRRSRPLISTWTTRSISASPHSPRPRPRRPTARKRAHDHAPDPAAHGLGRACG